jgi:hypothetical protein
MPGILYRIPCGIAICARERQALGKDLEVDSGQEARRQPRHDPLLDESQRAKRRSRVLLLPAPEAQHLLTLQDGTMEPCPAGSRLLQCQALPEEHAREV